MWLVRSKVWSEVLKFIFKGMSNRSCEGRDVNQERKIFTDG